MTPEEYRKAADLFEQLRERPESEIPAALDAACAGSADLRAQVLLLLEGDRRAAARSFLDRSALQDAARFAARSAAGPLAPGARLGPYTITGRIGAGGMGEVDRARDSRLDRDVAIKVLPSLLARDAEYLARFAREAQVLALINHPNIAVIHGVEEERALVMELVEGSTLAEQMATQRPTDAAGNGCRPSPPSDPQFHRSADGKQAVLGRVGFRYGAISLDHSFVRPGAPQLLPIM